MISSNRLWVSGLTAAALALLPGSSEAQTMARSFEQLQQRIPQAEETVVVIHKMGQETSDRIAGVSFGSSDAVTGPDSFRPTMPGGWFERAIDREVSRLKLSAPFAHSALLVVQQPGPEKQSWIGRHPALFGALVGFAVGFLIGYLPGDDGVFDDFTAGFNGWVMGGIGAGTGAAVGAVVGASRK